MESFIVVKMEIVCQSRSQLFSLGLYGAILYSVLKYGKLKETLFVGLIIFIGNMLLQGKAQILSFIIRYVFSSQAYLVH